MCSSKQHQEAQIGIVAVLLTTILLAIGVSVGSRVIRQTRDETIRQEATQQLNQAESVADMGKDDTSSDNSLIDLSHTKVKVGNVSPTMSHEERTKTFSSDIDTVYLNQGETVEVDTEKVGGNVFWELEQNKEAECPKKPGLLLTFINTIDGSSKIIPVTPSCGKSDFTTTLGLGSPGNDRYVNSFSFSAVATGYQRLRIEALFAPTYVYLQGLTTAVRTAAVNQSGEEARAVEQTTSFDTPNFVNNFTLFAGNSSICQGKFERSIIDGILESDGKPGKGKGVCK